MNGALEAATPFDWTRIALAIYVLATGTLLVRLGAGLALNRRLLRASRAAGRTADGIAIRESDRVASPVVLGIVRPAIVLPADWREWDDTRREAVLAHERSHIRRHDPAMQLLSAIHRALLWHSPFSWHLHRSIVRAAEDASDDAAVAATADRATYAQTLLDFMQRGVRGAGWQGVAMARYGPPGERIHRVLDGTSLSRGVTRWSLAAILALGSPVVYVVAAAHPQTTPQPPIAAVAAFAPETAAQASTPPRPPAAPAPPAQAATPPRVPSAAAPPAQAATPQPRNGTIRRFMIFSGYDTTTGSWDSRDPVNMGELRARFGSKFAWFERDGNEYVVTDAAVLAELERAMEPQREVNRMQSEVNRQQASVNGLQAGVNSQQNEVNALQHEVNRRQDLVNRIQSAAGSDDREALIRQLEAAIAELRASKNEASQEAVNRRQQQVNQSQARVNAEQGKVNEQQNKVNDQQQRVSADFNRRIAEILDSALERHLAQQFL